MENNNQNQVNEMEIVQARSLMKLKEKVGNIALDLSCAEAQADILQEQLNDALKMIEELTIENKQLKENNEKEEGSKK
jgi:hypothetical protein